MMMGRRSDWRAVYAPLDVIDRFVPDGRRIAVSVEAQRLQVWDLAGLREQFRALGLDWAER